MTKARRPAAKKDGEKAAEKTASKKSLFSSLSLPSFVPEPLRQPKAKQVVDVALFTATVYLIYNYGKDLAKKVEDMCPSEKAIMEMMQQ